MLVPSRGWTACLQGVVDTAEFALLGPFFRGQWVERLELGGRSSATIVIEWGAVWTPSDNASLDAWRSGAPIIQRSSTMGDDQPVFSFAMGNANLKHMRFAVGRRVGDTPMYIVCRCIGSHGSSFCDVYFSAFCVEELSERV